MQEISPESLKLFNSAADRFFKEELKQDVSEEIVRNIFLYHFDSFSTAYTNYRLNPSEATRQPLIKIISVAKSYH